LAAERLQHLVLNSQGLFGKPLNAQQQSNGYVVVLAKAVPCQHTLGVLVASEIFRQQGWHVISPTGSDTSWMDTLAQSHVHLLGVSVAHSDQLSPAQTLIAACRRLSKNANLSVMVGGPYAMTCVDLAATGWMPCVVLPLATKPFMSGLRCISLTRLLGYSTK
jgi:methylmalonyl-CoA mutase cobalamin-binding subunit